MLKEIQAVRPHVTLDLIKKMCDEQDFDLLMIMINLKKNLKFLRFAVFAILRI
jgi:hypothetical protein